MPSLAVHNFGCRVNQAEAFAWSEAFLEMGLRLEREWSRSDIVLVNSCTLTGRADRDVRKFIRKVARDNPAARLVVTGCLAERTPAELAGMPNVAAVLPNEAKERLPEEVLALVRRGLAEKAGGKAEAGAAAEGWEEEPEADESFRSRALLKIQDGCDNRCAFCVIPAVRGRGRSVPPDKVAARARALAGRGFREVVLAGIHLSSYGEDLRPPVALGGLLRALEKVPGVARVRLSSLDPRKVDDEFIDLLASSRKICPHFHLSLQHASPRILKRMGRAAVPGAHGRILGELAGRRPEAALGADVIVGFPEETESDFDELRAFLEDSPLAYFHVFPFSPRQGTPAAGWPRPADRVVKDRAAALRRLSVEKNLRFRARFVGRELGAVVIRKTGREAEALTDNYIRVIVPTCAAPEREVVRVAVGRVLAKRTEGEVVA